VPSVPRARLLTCTSCGGVMRPQDVARGEQAGGLCAQCRLDAGADEVWVMCVCVCVCVCMCVCVWLPYVCACVWLPLRV
jgi:hypothetical protein